MFFKIYSFLLTILATYYFSTLAQTYLHYLMGHRWGGSLFVKNHITCHHAHYVRDHLTSKKYIPDEKNNTPYLMVPFGIIYPFVYLFLPRDLFLVSLVTVILIFIAHIYLHGHYHLEDTWLNRFAWFRRKQQLHFIHHRKMGTNFGVIEFFWDKLFGTYCSSLKKDAF